MQTTIAAEGNLSVKEENVMLRHRWGQLTPCMSRQHAVEPLCWKGWPEQSGLSGEVRATGLPLMLGRHLSHCTGKKYLVLFCFCFLMN